MYYCIVNVKQGKISHVYQIYKDKQIAERLTDLLCFNFTPALIIFKTNKIGMHREIAKIPKRHAGLPMLIQVDTDIRSRVYGKIFSGQYTILQEYEYPLVA